MQAATYCSVFIVLSLVPLAVNSECTETIEGNVTIIQGLLDDWNKTRTTWATTQSEVEWAWATDITDAHAVAKAAIAAKVAEIDKQIWQQARCIDCTECTDYQARRVEQYLNIGTNALDDASFKTFTNVQTEMETIYAEAKVCLPDGSSCGQLDPDLTKIMATSDDYCELSWAWEGWRNETGRKMRKDYLTYVDLMNKAGNANGYSDPNAATSMWTAADADDEPDYFEQIEQAWQDVKPLYRELHTYVKNALVVKKAFKNMPDTAMPTSGHIPAHLTGNMWAQDWSSLYKLVIPDRTAEAVDIEALMVEAKYTWADMFKLSNQFFMSLGMEPMTDEFWKNSVFAKKTGVEMVCHASAWDFSRQDDYRVKMCTVVTAEDFQTVHHEMGHIQYDMHYKGQPIEFRTGANPGFHEAVGDLIALSVMTPGHLKTINLLAKDFNVTDGIYLNSLMQMALQKVAFLPFGYLIDKYRWDVFDKKAPAAKLNAAWWEYRCREQGVSPPVVRDDQLDFDAGSKYHVPAGVSYIRYFFAHIVQFQFHEAMCKQIGFQNDFHKCDIFNHKDAGKMLSDMLALGKSVPYPQALKNFTGYEGINATALINYFQPLYDWLKEQNKKLAPTFKQGWDDKCLPKPAYTCKYAPTAETTTPDSAIAARHEKATILLAFLSTIIVAFGMRV